jgi:hypothetical protein
MLQITKYIQFVIDNFITNKYQTSQSVSGVCNIKYKNVVNHPSIEMEAVLIAAAYGSQYQTWRTLVSELVSLVGNMLHGSYTI